MTVTATYNPDLGRVQITANGLAAADYATVERSLNQVTWTTVRGAGAVPVTGGVMDLTVDDYEFSDGEINYYRVRGVETGPIEFIASGGGALGNNASVNPSMPAGIIAGDLLVILASIRNSGTGTVNVPAGWTQMRQFGNVSLLGRRYQTGDTAPTVTFSGGVAGADTMARMAAWRRAELAPVTGADLLNPSAQDAPYPGLTVPAANMAIIDVAWKADDYSSLTGRASPGTYTIIGGVISTVGDDAAMSWWWNIQTTAADLTSGTHVVTGGAAAISRTMVVALEHAEFLNEQTTSVTPQLSGECGDSAVWLKSIARPFLNRTVQVVHRNPDTVTRPARTGVFDIIGRTMPVAVNDVRKSRRWTLYVRTESQTEADLIDLLLASGDVLLIQPPAGCEALIPAGYVSVGDATYEWHPLRPLSRLWTLPVVEVAPPGSDVVGASVTWQSVINAYDSWTEVLANHTTWADLLTLVGSPSEVIVA